MMHRCRYQREQRGIHSLSNMLCPIQTLLDSSTKFSDVPRNFFSDILFSVKHFKGKVRELSREQTCHASFEEIGGETELVY